MSTPVELANSAKLPHAVERSSKHETVAHDKLSRGKHLQGAETYAVAPYQAMPVAGPVITHNRAPALDVLEPSDELSHEVSGRPGGARVAQSPECGPEQRTPGRRRSWRTT